MMINMMPAGTETLYSGDASIVRFLFVCGLFVCSFVCF